MVKLSEREVVAFFIGKRVNSLRLSSIASACHQGNQNYKDCVEHIVNISELRWNTNSYIRTYRDMKNTDLMLLLYLIEDTIIGVRIFKYKTIIYPEGVASGYEATPCQEDIALVNNVLRFVVPTEESEDNHESDQNRQ